MSFPRLITTLACLLFFSTNALAADVQVNYEYTQKPQVDFSKTSKGSLKIAPFTDERGDADANQIGDATLESSAAEIVNDALVQSFIAGGAALVNEGESFTLEGAITEMSITEKGADLQVTIRTHVTLRAGNRTAFDSVIFGRAAAPELGEAIRGALDKLVNSLILDDYFLMEVI